MPVEVATLHLTQSESEFLQDNVEQVKLLLRYATLPGRGSLTLEIKGGLIQSISHTQAVTFET